MKFFARVPKIDFMAQRKAGLVISGLLTAITLVLMFTRGLALGIDFTGGVLVEVVYPQTIELDDVRKDLAGAHDEKATVQYFGGTSDVLIRLPPEENTSSAQVS